MSYRGYPSLSIPYHVKCNFALSVGRLETPCSIELLTNGLLLDYIYNEITLMSTELKTCLVECLVCSNKTQQTGKTLSRVHKQKTHSDTATCSGLKIYNLKGNFNYNI